MEKIDVLRIFRQLGAINRGIQAQKNFYLEQQQYQMLILDYQNSINDSESHTNTFVSIIICEISIFVAVLQLILPTWKVEYYRKFIFGYLCVVLFTFGVWFIIKRKDKKKIREVQVKIRDYYNRNMKVIDIASDFDDLQILYSEIEILNEVMDEYNNKYKKQSEKLAKVQSLVSDQLAAIKKEIRKRGGNE